MTRGGERFRRADEQIYVRLIRLYGYKSRFRAALESPPAVPENEIGGVVEGSGVIIPLLTRYGDLQRGRLMALGAVVG